MSWNDVHFVELVEQELLTLPEYLSSSPDLSGIRVTLSLALCVCFVDRCLSFCTSSFGHCVVCSTSIYGFWLSLWYLPTLLQIKQIEIIFWLSSEKLSDITNWFLYLIKKIVKQYWYTREYCKVDDAITIL